MSQVGYGEVFDIQEQSFVNKNTRGQVQVVRSQEIVKVQNFNCFQLRMPGYINF